MVKVFYLLLGVSLIIIHAIYLITGNPMSFRDQPLHPLGKISFILLGAYFVYLALSKRKK